MEKDQAAAGLSLEAGRLAGSLDARYERMKQQIDAEVAAWKEDWQQRIHQAETRAEALALETGDVRRGRRVFLEQWEQMMGRLKDQLERQAAAQKDKIQELKKKRNIRRPLRAEGLQAASPWKLPRKGNTRSRECWRRTRQRRGSW